MKNNDSIKDKLFRVLCNSGKTKAVKFIHGYDLEHAKRKFIYLYGDKWNLIDIKIVRRSFKPKTTTERKVI